MQILRKIEKNVKYFILFEAHLPRTFNSISYKADRFITKKEQLKPSETFWF